MPMLFILHLIHMARLNNTDQSAKFDDNGAKKVRLDSSDKAQQIEYSGTGVVKIFFVQVKKDIFTAPVPLYSLCCTLDARSSFNCVLDKTGLITKYEIWVRICLKLKHAEGSEEGNYTLVKHDITFHSPVDIKKMCSLIS